VTCRELLRPFLDDARHVRNLLDAVVQDQPRITLVRWRDDELHVGSPSPNPSSWTQVNSLSTDVANNAHSAQIEFGEILSTRARLLGKNPRATFIARDRLDAPLASHSPAKCAFRHDFSNDQELPPSGDGKGLRIMDPPTR